MFAPPPKQRTIKKDYTANGVSEWEIQNSNWAQGIFAKIIDHWASLVAPKMEK